MASVPLAVLDDDRAPKLGQYTLLPSNEDNPDHKQNPRSTTTERRSSRIVSAFQTACLIFFTICAITFVLSSSGTVDRSNQELLDDDTVLSDYESQTGSHLPQCAHVEPVTPSKHHDSVWTSLTVQEAVDVRKWLFEGSRELNLTRGDTAVMKYVAFFLDLFTEMAYNSKTNSGPLLIYLPTPTRQ